MHEKSNHSSTETCMFAGREGSSFMSNHNKPVFSAAQVQKALNLQARIFEIYTGTQLPEELRTSIMGRLSRAMSIEGKVNDKAGDQIIARAIEDFKKGAAV